MSREPLDTDPLLAPSVNSSSLQVANNVGIRTTTVVVESHSYSTADRRRATAMIGSLFFVNVAALSTLALAGTRYPSIVGPGLLAFTFGLRHAVDADHIAAIDNVTRKLIQDGKRPISVGLWFSLGHCTIVFIMCIGVAAGSSFLRQHIGDAESIGAIIGTVVSATMLFIIGAINLYILWKLRREWRAMREHDAKTKAVKRKIPEVEHWQLHANGIDHDDDDNDDHTHIVTVAEDGTVEASSPGGILTKCCPVVLRAVDREWKMYPVGFLFGLGFDTASEVALLALAALGTKHGVPPLCVMLLPVAFGAGMALLDTLDGIMMVWAYGWAMIHPGRKIYFNMFITGLSAVIAIVVGIVEVLGCIQQEMNYNSGFWDVIATINNHFEIVGYSIIGLFVISIVVAVIVYKFNISPSLSPVSFEEAKDSESSHTYSQDDYIRRRMLKIATAETNPPPAKKVIGASVTTSSSVAIQQPGQEVKCLDQDDYLKARMLELACKPIQSWLSDSDGPT